MVDEIQQNVNLFSSWILLSYCQLSWCWLSCLDLLVLLLPKLWINWFSNLSILNVPDEGNSRNVSRALSLISTFFLALINKQSTKHNVGSDIVSSCQIQIFSIWKYIIYSIHTSCKKVLTYLSLNSLISYISLKTYIGWKWL